MPMPEGKCPYRNDIRVPPKRMLDLPVDKRGYPVPYFVDWIKGEPEFRAMDRLKLARCMKHKLCWTCGKKLFDERVFVVGPMCAVNRISAEPPNHRECAQYSAINCPFLSKPKMVRRRDGLQLATAEEAPGLMLERNPGVTLLWYTRSFLILKEPNGVLFRMGRAFKVEWYAEGRQATREEILASIESGLPFLRKAADLDGPEAHVALTQQVDVAMKLVPRV
jgi:hypothetical protein